jgi:hypothetical protein
MRYSRLSERGARPSFSPIVLVLGPPIPDGLTGSCPQDGLPATVAGSLRATVETSSRCSTAKEPFGPSLEPERERERERRSAAARFGSCPKTSASPSPSVEPIWRHRVLVLKLGFCFPTDGIRATRSTIRAVSRLEARVARDSRAISTVSRCECPATFGKLLKATPTDWPCHHGADPNILGPSGTAAPSARGSEAP